MPSLCRRKVNGKPLVEVFAENVWSAVAPSDRLKLQKPDGQARRGTHSNRALLRRTHPWSFTSKKERSLWCALIKDCPSCHRARRCG